jgi:hypothetical protein
VFNDVNELLPSFINVLVHAFQSVLLAFDFLLFGNVARQDGGGGGFGEEEGFDDVVTTAVLGIMLLLIIK